MTQDLPSASQMYRLANCVGSRNFIRVLREERMLTREIAGPEATLGTRIHAYLEGLPEELGLKAKDIADSCERLARKAFENYFGKGIAEKTLYEERLTYMIVNTPFFTGKPDRVSLYWESGLNVNYKTGRKASPEPHLNLQLRTEIVLLKHAYPNLLEIAGTIVEPLVTQKPEIVVYGPDELKKAETEILEIVDASEWGIKRTAGAWCVHCSARAFCPEAKQYALAHPPSVEVANLPLGEEGAQLLERIEIADKILSGMKEAYKTIVAEKLDAIPGWHISEGKNVRFIKDVFRAEEIADQSIPEGVDTHDLVKMSMPLGKLEERMAAAWNMSGAAFAKKFASEFGIVIGTKLTKGSLERIPKRLLK